jgi:hypothetical protein
MASKIGLPAETYKDSFERLASKLTDTHKNFTVEQLHYLVSFLEKAGAALDTHSRNKNYPEAAGVGAGAISGAYAWLSSLISLNEPSRLYSSDAVEESDHD